MSAFICVCLCLSVSVSLTLKLTNPFSHTILLHCHRSEQAGDVLLQSTANRALGTLYSKVGELDKSVDALTRHFSLLSDILGRRGELGEAAAHITARDLDLARVYLGVSRGNAQVRVSLSFSLSLSLSLSLPLSSLSSLN